MRKKVRKSLAFLLALALVVSVMSGLGLSVSADDDQITTTESVQTTDVEGKPAEKDALKDEGDSSEEEQPTEPVKEPENQDKPAGEGSGEAAKGTTADSNDEQKDEPQAEPAAEDTVDVSKLLGKQLYDYMNTLDDEAYDVTWEELSETQKASYESYVKEVMFGKNPKIITETVTHGAAVSVTNAAGLMTFDYSSGRMRAAPMRAAANTTLSDKKVPVSSGLIMSKSITKDVKDTIDTKYTIQLESYAAGKVTTTTKGVPCDIVLVLDESGSMASEFEKMYGYQKFGSDTTNRSLFNRGNYKDKTFVKRIDTGELIPVRVTRKTVNEGLFGNRSYYTYQYTYDYNGDTYQSEVFF